MGARSSRNLTLDAGALIAFDRGDSRVRQVIREAIDREVDIAIPAGALAQAWRNGSRQARLGVLVADRSTRTEPLTELIARAAGALCGRAKTSDVIDASVVLCARRQGNAVVLTSDPNDLALLDPQIRVATV
ncbi:MAG: PIN domain-containing protein [Candidatus Dormibacteria bacterium]